MSERSIDLVYFDGCPNVDEARANLRAVLADGGWREWNLLGADIPDRFHRYGSPTVLVGGADMTGEGRTTGAMACRADGAPSRDAIREALAGEG